MERLSMVESPALGGEEVQPQGFNRAEEASGEQV